MRHVIAFLALPLSACGWTPARMPADWTSKSSAEQRAILDRIADNCSLPHDFFRLRADEISLLPRADEEYERVDCALEALRKIRGLPRMGFVGNEYYVGNEQ